MTRENVSTALSLILVEIDGSGISQGRTYKDKETGNTKPLGDTQTGYLWMGGRYPVQVAIDIPKGAAPYAPGTYVPAGPLFQAGKFGRWEFVGTRELMLIPLDAAIRAMIEIHKEETGEVIDFPPAKTGKAA